MARTLSLLKFRRRQKRRRARGEEGLLVEVVEMLEEEVVVDRVKEKVKSEDPNLYHSLPVYRSSVYISLHIDVSYQVVVTLLSTIEFSFSNRRIELSCSSGLSSLVSGVLVGDSRFIETGKTSEEIAGLTGTELYNGHQIQVVLLLLPFPPNIELFIKDCS